MWRSIFRKEENIAAAPAPEAGQNNLQSGDFTLGHHYPTPASGQTIIPFVLDAASKLCLTVYNGQGVVCAELCAGQFAAGANTILLPLPGWTPGTYTCRVAAENEWGSFSHTEQLVVK